MDLFADVILPLPLQNYFTYRITAEQSSHISSGCRVIVPFGRTKFYTAIVAHVHNVEPKGYETKHIISILDEYPVLIRPQLKFWNWLASYYQCTVGEVYKAALPSGLKLESETNVSLNEDFEETEDNKLKDKELLLLTCLKQNERMNVAELEKATSSKNLMPLIKSMLEKGAISLSEDIKKGYKPKFETYIKLSPAYSDNEVLKTLFEELGKAKKQLTLLMSFLELSKYFQKGGYTEVTKKDLLAKSDVSLAVLNGLVDKGILEVYKKESSRLVSKSRLLKAISPLSEEQKKAYDSILDLYKEKDITLLHGVTSSGKTEIFIHLINDILMQGRQVLYLVPEIALTTQLTERLQRVFGDQLAIYHSKFTDNERVEIWNSLLKNKKIKLVLGVRSSVFLPFKDLGLVIVDEEHETTYKQQDPAPRYHARNAAIVLASMHGAKTLLGTATPAIETYYNTQTGKYGLVELHTRFENIALPNIIPVDIKELKRKKRMVNNFSPTLIQKMNDALASDEQVILFQNRRGFAPMIECSLCAWVPKCKNCDVSLTYHKRFGQLTCHYCGYTVPVPNICPACGNKSLLTRGFGTEKIEDEVAENYPNVTLARMDLDTTRTRKAYETIINDFQNKKTKILIGTQMISKGLDFDNVSVVGILNADTMLNYPDFRSYEKAFQMMAQVSGRAGRKNKQGTVILQVSNPSLPIIQQIIANDYKGMYEMQLQERKAFNYPPFFRLIYIYMKHRHEHVLEELSLEYAKKLRSIFGHRILGPDHPPVARIQSLYIRKIILKIEINASMGKVKELLNEAHIAMLNDERFKSLILYYDVDPM